MTSRNDITGDTIQTKNSNDAYRDGWDRIFGKKPAEDPAPPSDEVVSTQDDADDM